MPAGHDGSATLGAKECQVTLIGDTPVAGFYKASLVRNGPMVPIRIWFGAPEIDGEPQDRAPRWCIEVDGKTDTIERDEAHPEYRCRVSIEVSRYWPWCGRNKITEQEYRYLIEHAKWARDHAPHLPDAQPRKAIDKRGASVF